MFKKYKETGIFDKNEIYPYITEGIGEDFLPQNVDFSLIDHFEKVTDKDAAIMTRRIAREEGIFAGNSAGSAMAGLLQLATSFKAGEMVVVIFHDHGTRYLGKMFNDDWMREKGFLDRKGLTARDLVADARRRALVTHRAHRDRGRGRAHHDRARLLADPGHGRRPHRRLDQRGAALSMQIVQDPECSSAAGRSDHAAGVSVRRHLDRASTRWRR